MKDVEFTIEENEAVMYFNGMLEKEDFDQFWKGVESDRNDGSDGSYSETVEKIWNIYSDHVLKDKSTDFQIWGPDPSFALHIDTEQVPQMVNEMKEAFPGLEVEYTGSKVEELFEKWIVVESTYQDEQILVTKRSNFEEMNFCGGYGDYGVPIGCYNAGCYSFNNSAAPIFDDFYNEASQKFGFNEDVLDKLELTHEELYEMLIEPKGSVGYKIMKEEIQNWDDVIKFFKEWREKNESHTEVTAWTYHDSHNFKTVVLKTDIGEPDYNELDKDEQVRILLELPGFPHIEGTNEIIETENYQFHFDRWATNPWFCGVEKK